MNPRQAHTEQIDQWYARREIQAWISTPIETQKARAIEEDHAAALEMNANGDAGRAGFLGIDTGEVQELPTKNVNTEVQYGAGNVVNPFKIGDEVTLTSYDDPGKITKNVGEDIWVETSCNMYRGYDWQNFKLVKTDMSEPRSAE